MSKLQQLFKADSIEFDARTFPEIAVYDIRKFILNKLGLSVTDELEYLHQVLPEKYKVYDIESGVNKISESLYDMGTDFMDHYHQFVKSTLRQYFQFPFYFQNTPTIRVQTPYGNADKHFPRYHNDLMYGHPPGEINIWMPLTDPVAPQGHGFKICGLKESKQLMEMHPYFIALATSDDEFSDKVDSLANSVITPFGKLLAFDSRCIHTTEPMQAHTRISIDVRIIAVNDYNALDREYRGAGRMKMLYAPGHAYHEFSSEEL